MFMFRCIVMFHLMSVTLYSYVMLLEVYSLVLMFLNGVKGDLPRLSEGINSDSFSSGSILVPAVLYPRM